MLSAGGLDWLFVDTEHAALDILAAQSLLQASRVPCIVRVPDGGEATLKKALDIGAAGVVVPMVNTAQQAKSIVSFCKYPPRGVRGVGLVRAQGYGFDFQRYVRGANDETVVVVQCEHIAAVEAIDAIVAVDGVDAVFVGPYDLSGSMGRLGDVEHPDVLAAIARVADSCRKAARRARHLRRIGGDSKAVHRAGLHAGGGGDGHDPPRRSRAGDRRCAEDRLTGGEYMAYENILTETRGRVGLITLNRPKQLNALNDALMNELGDALAAFEQDDGIGAIVLTGNEKAFAAGADIGAMKDWSYMDVYKSEYITRNWERIRTVRKPVIAAVAGFALGGGCEIALACDIVIAADTAKFGQPEIKLGVIPGAGGTQRLPRAVGKAKAMDLILTGRMMDAAEAERAGLVSRVVPAAKLLDEALAAANAICEFSLPSVMMAKEAINRAYETPLAEGILFERRLFHSLFATEDQKEGMAAFVDKRKPDVQAQR